MGSLRGGTSLGHTRARVPRTPLLHCSRVRPMWYPCDAPSQGATRVPAHDATMRSQVGPGGCPPRPPTDPDVRDYRIRLLGTADSLRTTRALGLLSERVALRCRTGSVSPTSFPPSVPLPRRPLPSPGSLRDQFPGFIGTMGRSDSPLSIPVGSFPRPAVPSRAPYFAPAIGEHSP